MPPEFSSLVPVRWSEVDAVVFDIGGVFLIRHPDPVRSGMTRAGFDLPEHAGTTYHDAHYHSVRALTDVMGDGNISEYAPDFWVSFERAYLTHLGVPQEQLEAAVEAMFREVFQKEPHLIWRLFLDDNIAAFKKLGASGMPVAIVTNNDGTAEAQMQRFGICQVGDGPLTNVAAIADSGTLKIAKPEPGIFTPALEALGTDPNRTLYIGDTVHADVVGATRAAMPVVQLDPLHLHAHLPHTRASSVAEVVALLGR